MFHNINKQLWGLALGLLIALPVAGQEASETPQPAEDKRVSVALSPLKDDEDAEAKKSRVETFPLSSASSAIPAPQPLAEGAGRGDGARQHRTLLRIGFSLTEIYDDNIFRRSIRVHDTFSQFSPSLTIDHLGRRTSTSLTYRGDGRVYRRHSNLNFFGHGLNFLEAFEGARWSARFSHNINYTPDPLLAFRTRTGEGELNNLLGPDGSLVTPHTERLFNASMLELGYRKSVRTSFTLAAGYRDTRGRGDQFVDYNEVALRAAYNYRHSPRGTISVFPNVGRVRSQGVFGNSKSYGLFLGHSYQVGERVWISFQGGPEYTQFEQPTTMGLSGPGTRSSTSWGGGANVVYNRWRSAFGLSYSRGVTGSGGLAGSVQNETFDASVSSRLFGRWSSGLAASYSDNRSFDALASSFQGINASFRLERELGESAGIFVSYDFARQVSGLTPFLFTRNFFTVGIRWGSHPIQLRK